MNKQAFYVTGTDTGVGKTLITAALIHKFAQAGFQTLGMKPVAAGGTQIAGVLQNEDVAMMRLASNIHAPLEHINPYFFATPMAPHLVAARSGEVMQLEKIRMAFDALQSRADMVIVEGAGGFLVPLNETQSMAEIPVSLALPVILVVGMRLGCLNHALLSAEAIRTRGLTLAGWVANVIDPHMHGLDENINCLKTLMDIRFMGTVPFVEPAQFYTIAPHLQLP